MKIGVIGDLHLTNHRPERRKDDYFQTILGKLKQALDIFEREGCIYILQVGDFFNSPTVANRVQAAAIRLLRQYRQMVCCVWGQHDITGHSGATVPNSPLAVLDSAGVVQILGEWLINKRSSPKICVYGSSFGEEIPKVENLDEFNILITHRMIGNRPLYPGQPLESPRVFLRQHPDFNLVLCGDYHYAFQDRYQGRMILNPGAMIRKNLTDVKLGLVPSVVIIDLPALEVCTFPLQVSDAEEVFDLSQPEKPIDSGLILGRFIQDLKESKAQRVGWKNLLLRLIQNQKVSEGAQLEIDSALEEVHDG